MFVCDRVIWVEGGGRKMYIIANNNGVENLDSNFLNGSNFHEIETAYYKNICLCTNLIK